MKILPWHKQHMQNWQSMVRDQRIPHAILLKGNKGIGKISLANEMARYLLCDDKSEFIACGHCKSCALYSADNHLDNIVIEAEDKIIKIDQIRNLTKKVGMTSTRGQFQLVTIKDIEKLNIASANALLKTLEEPPQKTVILLTCNDFDRVLPTIKSRCFQIDVILPEVSQLYSWLEQDCGFSKNDAKNAALLSNNAPLLASRIIHESVIENIYQMVEELNLLKQQKLSIPAVSSGWVSNGFENNLSLISTILMNQYKVDTFSQDEPHQKLMLDIKHKNTILDYIRAINLTSKRFNTTLKKELLIEELLINWQNV